MVTHIVIFTWIPDATAAQIDALRGSLDRLSTELSDLVEIAHGPDLQWRESNGDYAIVATFADRKGWDTYQADPRHKAFVQDFVLPIQAARLTLQFQNAE